MEEQSLPSFDICITCNKNKSIARFLRILVPTEYPSKLNFLTADFTTLFLFDSDFHRCPIFPRRHPRRIREGKYFSPSLFQLKDFSKTRLTWNDNGFGRHRNSTCHSRGGWIRDNTERIFVRIECHVENTSGGRKDNRSFGVRGFQTRFLLPFPPIETWAGRGGEIRGAICHPPIVCLSSTTILIPKHELRNPSQILFSSRGGLWRCPSTTVLELISHQESIPAETSISLEYGARWATWTEFLRNLWTRERSGIRFSIATLVLFCVSLLTPLFPLESTRPLPWIALSSLSRTVDLTKENWKRRIRSAVIASHV